MDDLTFLETAGEPGASNATLKAVLSTGQVCHISDDICPYKFLDQCPLLYHAFEYGVRSRLQASIEAPSTSAVISLLRYCYTGSYLSPLVDDTPILLLPHIETYKMALDFDVPELQLLANGNLSCQIDFSCCLPNPPQDLLETIRFIYEHFADQQSRQQHGLVATLLNYCIQNFLYHQLGESPEFLNLVSELPDFRQDLCRTNMERNFEDECAFDIIRLSLDTLQATPSSLRPTLLASRDLPQEMLFDIPEIPQEYLALNDLSQGMLLEDLIRSSENMTDSVMTAFRDENHTNYSTATDEAAETHGSDLLATATTILAHRPRNPFLDPDEDLEAEPSSDEDGFALVHRPRPQAVTTPDGIMSSPEVLPATVYVPAMTGSDYTSDDEWSLVDS